MSISQSPSLLVSLIFLSDRESVQQPVSQSVLQPVNIYIFLTNWLHRHEYSILEKKMIHLLFHVHLSLFYFFLVKAKNFSGPTIPFYLSYYLIYIIILPNYMPCIIITIFLHSLMWFG